MQYNVVVKKISLTQGQFSLIDDDDFEKFGFLKWSVTKMTRGGKSVFYAYRKKFGKTVYLHREILDNPNGEVDHINRNRLDNRKSNLRIITREENAKNHNLYFNNTSGHVGVYWHSKNKNWQVRINRKSIKKSFGSYKTKEEAIKVYLQLGL